MSTEMKKLIIGGTEYEIVDDAGRTRITALEQSGGSGAGLTQTEKNLILELFDKAEYTEDASTALNALSALWSVYSVAWSGTGYTKSNSAESVGNGETFISTIIANTGFNITAVAVTMGGTEVIGAWSNGTVTIPNVTGDIVITVTTARPYRAVSWLFNENTPQYAIGDSSAAYQAWCPHNLQYDNARNKFIFTQQHSSKHGSGATAYPATMYEIDPSDPLKKTQIQIPDIRGIANLVILPNGTYVLYPKTATTVRYVSTDGGATWSSENLSGSSQHFFGVYYCNGEYYAGCDYEWGEYHHSVDGLTWTTETLDWTDENGCHTKEHSFCYWNNHVYAFGRRDFYENDDASQGLVDDYNGCAVVFRLDNGVWTMIDDSSLAAFQSNCSPVTFDDYIAIAHIDRTSSATLRYSIYDGTTFQTIQTWSGLVLSGSQAAFTTPALAFGNGYACIAYSTMPVLHQLDTAAYRRSINSIIIGTTEGKTTKEYFTYTQLASADAPNISKIFALTPDELTFLPSGAESDIAWRWNTGAANPNYDNIINNGTSDAYYYYNNYNNLMHVHIDSPAYLVKDGKFVRTTAAGVSMNNDTQKNWIFSYDGRWFAVSGKLTDYDSATFQCAHQFVVDCTFTDSPTQPSIDISGVPDGTILRLISANGGTSGKFGKVVSYISPITEQTAE